MIQRKIGWLTMVALAAFVVAGCGGTQKMKTADGSSPQDVAVEREATARDGGMSMPMDRGSIREEGISRGGGDLTDIYFDYDRAMVLSDARRILEENAGWLRANPSARIVIEGHSDARGTAEYNIALGARRAKAVKKVLVALGVDPSRIETISYGEERPFCSSDAEGCWKLNRRGHFVASSR